jgi:hypothetical protein
MAGSNRRQQEKGMETEHTGQRRSSRKEYNMRKKKKKDIRLQEKKVLYSTPGSKLDDALASGCSAIP